MYSSSKCNRIASEVYDTRSDNECRKLRIPDITQLRTPILSDCIQKWGKNTESNGTKLFINDQYTVLFFSQKVRYKLTFVVIAIIDFI